VISLDPVVGVLPGAVPRHCPPVDGDMVDLDAALGEQRFDVAVEQAEAQVQRTATTITSDGSASRRRRTAGLEQGEGGQFPC